MVYETQSKILKSCGKISDQQHTHTYFLKHCNVVIIAYSNVNLVCFYTRFSVKWFIWVNHDIQINYVPVGI